MTKSEVRDRFKRARANLSAEEKKQKSLSAQEYVIGREEYRRARSIMLYYPLGSEVDTALIAKTAFADGKRVIYPVTDEKSGEITPIEVTEDARFERGGFGIYEPRGEEYKGKIDLVVLPGVAFDQNGGRVGFGKGCYDNFLGNIDTFNVGLCYGIQLIDEVPTEEHDVRMDMIVTECGIVEIKKNA